MVLASSRDLDATGPIPYEPSHTFFSIRDKELARGHKGMATPTAVGERSSALECLRLERVAPAQGISSAQGNVLQGGND